MSDYRELINIINKAENIVFFGGAGVSCESGIPDFRGSEGLYTKGAESNGKNAEEMLEYRYFASNPEEFYEFYKRKMLFPEARPNPAHKFLARLEREGKLSAVITQNIDGLHQKAGSCNVIELHGTTLENSCMRCGHIYGIDKVLKSDGVPRCEKCDGIIRPNIVFYGEGLDSGKFYDAAEAMSEADVLIVGGTSLNVQPAAGLVTHFRGDSFIIINMSPTPYDGLADLIIDDPIGEVFAYIDDYI